MLIGIDFETYCELDIREVGLDNYLNHPSFTPLLAAVNGLDPYEGSSDYSTVFDFIGQPHDLKRFTQFLAFNNTDTYVASNAGFERGVIARMGWPTVRIIDSAVAARLNGGSSRLEFAAAQFTGMKKLASGRHLINMYCKGPTPPSQHVATTDDWEEFKKYVQRDASLALKIAMEARVAHFESDEHELEEITHRMNQVGWPVDIRLVKMMLVRYEKNCKEELDQFRARYDPDRYGINPNTDQYELKPKLNIDSHKQLKEWCAERGIISKSFDTANVTDMIGKIERRIASPSFSVEDPRYEKYLEVLALLKLKQTLGGSSISKLPRILQLVSADGRLRNQYMHAGAGQSGRTSGVGVQMQNLKRLKDAKHPRDVDTIYDYRVKWTNEDLIGNIRQVFYAPNPEGRIIVGDLASIESRMLAFVAGEDWKIENYRLGRDMYKVTAAVIFSCAYEDVTDAQRTPGKVGELSCGYGAAAAAVAAFAKNMGITMSEAEAASLVADWRKNNPRIKGLWDNLNAALHAALVSDSIERVIVGDFMIKIYSIETPASLQAQHPGARTLLVQFKYKGLLVFDRVIQGAYLRGRDICYYKPDETQSGPAWKSWYINPKTKQREFYRIYGGKLTGILIQSMCRELFFHTLRRTEQHFAGTGVELIGQFHDEIVLHWDPDKATIPVHEAEAKLTWAMTHYPLMPEFPLAAEVKSARRYVK